jgi:hypothetical protein
VSFMPCNLWRRSGVVVAVTNKFLFEPSEENHVLHKKTLIALAAAVALGCVPMATNALAAGHQNSGHGGGGQAFAGHGGGGHAMAGPARGGRGSAGYAGGGRVVRSGGGGYYGGGYYGGGGPIYDSCSDYGYGYSGCPGYGVPIVGAVINGVFGGYGGY